MKYKAYLLLLFSSIIPLISLIDANSKAQYEPNLPPSVQTVCKNFDKKIENQHIVIKSTISKIETNFTTAQFLNCMNEAHETLQKQPIYEKAKALQESIRLVEELKKYNEALIQPNILQKINRSLRLPILQEHDLLLSFLRKERIHMLEMNDEYIVIQTFCRHIKTIEQELHQELISFTEQLCTTPEILELYDLHRGYLKNEDVLLLQKTCTTLWNLYLDKEIKILKQVSYRETLHSNLQKNLVDHFEYTCSKGLKEIIEIEKRYYLAPYNTSEFAQICIRLPFE